MLSLIRYVSATRMFRQLHTDDIPSPESRGEFDTELPHLTTVVTSMPEDDAVPSTLHPLDAQHKSADLRDLDSVTVTPSTTATPVS